jgi:NAD(P)H-hydrate epimerase
VNRQNIKRVLTRKKATHKGDYGHVLVLAGSKGLTGAAFLTSQAALLSGSGLVTLGIPESLNPIMERKLTEVMTLPLPETKEASLSVRALTKIKNFLHKADAIAIGPGLSQNVSTKQLVKRLVRVLRRPFVLDANGINAFADNAPLLKRIRNPLSVITPHPGELARLLQTKVRDIQKNRIVIARRLAKEYNKVFVLKGHRTVVSSPGGRHYINTTGNPGMASGGTGDVLTGIIASLLGQGIDPFQAASIGAYVHGLAGDLARRERGEISLRATDLLHKLPEAFKRIVR